MKKKLAILIAAVAFVFAVMPAMAKVERETVDTWELTASNAIVFGCGGGSYAHTLGI
jgi:hypothetical protein